MQWAKTKLKLILSSMHKLANKKKLAFCSNKIATAQSYSHTTAPRPLKVNKT